MVVGDGGRESRSDRSSQLGAGWEMSRHAANDRSHGGDRTLDFQEVLLGLSWVGKISREGLDLTGDPTENSWCAIAVSRGEHRVDHRHSYHSRRQPEK